MSKWWGHVMNVAFNIERRWVFMLLYEYIFKKKEKKTNEKKVIYSLRWRFNDRVIVVMNVCSFTSKQVCYHSLDFNEINICYKKDFICLIAVQNERQPRNTATIRPESLVDMDHERAIREAAVAVGVFG